MTSLRLEIEHDQARQAVIVYVHGEVDAFNAHDVVQSLSDKGLNDAVFLDLSDVQYFDSAGMAAIERLRTTTKLQIIAPEGSIVRRGLEITGFDQLVPIVERLQDVPATPSTRLR
jgi:anti-anti-sigma factor